MCGYTLKKLKSIKNFFSSLLCCCCCMYKTINDCNKNIRHA